MEATTMARSDLSYMARLAEMCERYDEMMSLMRTLVVLYGSPTEKERMLLSVGYKNALNRRRAASRILYNLELEAGKHANEFPVVVTRYREKVEAEEYKLCRDMITILEDHILTAHSQHSPEARVFYYQLLGDYYRYITDLSPTVDREDTKKRALLAYDEAVVAAMSLSPVHPTRLGLALNFSVFFHDIMFAPEEACNIAQKAFDAALVELECTADDPHHQTTIIMQLLRDNLAIWTSVHENPIPKPVLPSETARSAHDQFLK